MQTVCSSALCALLRIRRCPIGTSQHSAMNAAAAAATAAASWRRKTSRTLEHRIRNIPRCD